MALSQISQSSCFMVTRFAVASTLICSAWTDCSTLWGWYLCTCLLHVLPRRFAFRLKFFTYCRPCVIKHTIPTDRYRWGQATTLAWSPKMSICGLQGDDNQVFTYWSIITPPPTYVFYSPALLPIILTTSIRYRGRAPASKPNPKWY